MCRTSLLVASLLPLVAAAQSQPVYRLWAMNADGSNKTVLFESTDSQFTHPHPSPDGSRIAGVVYTRDVDGDGLRNENDIQASAIAVINADGTGFRVVADVPNAVDSHPAWSPDGTRLLFTSGAGHPLGPFVWDLYTVNADGTNRRRATNTFLVSEGDPHWGANGKFAFVRAPLFEVTEGRPQQIYVSNEDGSGLTRVSGAQPGDGENVLGFATGPYDPVWDPAGERLVWSEVPADLSGLSRFLDFDAVVVNEIGQPGVDVSQNVYSDLMPRWSPDGSRLVFWVLVARDAGRLVFDDVLLMNPDGTGRLNLTSDLDDEASMPDWFPDGRIVFTALDHQGTAPRAARRLWGPPMGALGEATTAALPASAEASRPLVAVRAVPNPSRGRTAFSFDLKEPGDVSLRVYDLLGRSVATLADGPMGAGPHRVVWEAARLPEGIYVYDLQAGGARARGRVTHLR